MNDTTGGKKQATQAMMNKIMALLQKATSTTFEAERDAYLAKAQELMIAYDVDQSQLRPEEKDKITTVKVHIGALIADAHLWDMVCKVRGATIIQLRNGKKTTGTIVGYEQDLTFIRTLMAMLIMQRERALAVSGKPDHVHGKTWGASFRIAYGRRVVERLEEAKRSTVTKSGPGTDLVLVDKSKLVEQHLKTIFPNTRTFSLSSSARSTEAYSRGRDAGSRADLSGGTGTLNRSGQHALDS